MKKYNYGISAIFFALAGYIFFATKDFKKMVGDTPGAGYWPRILAAVLIVGSLGLIIQTALNKEDEDAPIKWKSEEMKQIYITFGLLIIFVALLEIIGLILDLILFIPAVMYLLGERRKKALVVFPLCLSAFVYVLFGILLRLSLPVPFFM